MAEETPSFEDFWCNLYASQFGFGDNKIEGFLRKKITDVPYEMGFRARLKQTINALKEFRVEGVISSPNTKKDPNPYNLRIQLEKALKEPHTLIIIYTGKEMFGEPFIKKETTRHFIAGYVIETLKNLMSVPKFRNEVGVLNIHIPEASELIGQESESRETIRTKTTDLLKATLNVASRSYLQIILDMQDAESVPKGLLKQIKSLRFRSLLSGNLQWASNIVESRGLSRREFLNALEDNVRYNPRYFIDLGINYSLEDQSISKFHHRSEIDELKGGTPPNWASNV